MGKSDYEHGLEEGIKVGRAMNKPPAPSDGLREALEKIAEDGKYGIGPAEILRQIARTALDKGKK